MTQELSLRPPAEPPVQWYARSSIDEFLAAAAARRAELEAVIADANARAERARAAAGLHRLMATMVLETQRELVTMRRAAEAQAAEIVTRGEPEIGTEEGGDATHEAVSDHGVSSDQAIDLTDRAAPDDSSTPSPVAATDVPPPSPYHSNGNGDGQHADAGDAEFIAFLRDGLSDSGPLEPPSS